MQHGNILEVRGEKPVFQSKRLSRGKVGGDVA